MKLLLDQNLSPSLVQHLADVFPDSSHVFLLSLDQVEDTVVWEYAKEHEFTLVSKDADFNDLATLYGFPPRVIWIRRGNCKTSAVQNLLRIHLKAIENLHQREMGVLALF